MNQPGKISAPLAPQPERWAAAPCWPTPTCPGALACLALVVALAEARHIKRMIDRALDGMIKADGLKVELQTKDGWVSLPTYSAPSAEVVGAQVRRRWLLMARGN